MLSPGLVSVTPRYRATLVDHREGEAAGEALGKRKLALRAYMSWGGGGSEVRCLPMCLQPCLALEVEAMSQL